MDNSKSWSKILEQVKQEISASNFKTWFSKIELEDLTDDSLIIKVPSAFIKEQLSIRYQPILEKSAEQVTGKILKISYQIDSALSSKQSKEPEEDLFFPSQTFSTQTPTSNLNPRYTLENFVVGLTNNLAYAAGQAVVQNPGISYNPLFIYGPSGVGKTHLMQAIGNAIYQKNPYIKIMFASSEKFMNDLVESIQSKRTGDFRQKYRSSELLLIDDIQFISGKDSTQEEFFHTFNELQSKNVQIILTSDRPPTEMLRLESRLLSRFQGGLMVDIQLPDYDTRLAILRAKLIEKGETLPDEYLNIIAEAVASSTRELEGKLIQVIQVVKFNQATDADTVRKIVGKSLPMTGSAVDHKKVLGIINQYFNTKMNDLAGPRRQKELVFPRQIAMFLLYEDCKMPMEKIGQVLGGRDHTTVLHGIEKIRHNLGKDSDIQKIMGELRQQSAS